MNPLAKRQALLLKLVITHYISEGVPVGSALLSDQLASFGHVGSPATVRNELTQLEQLGLVEQPHTSAGRIPTVEGLRYYIDSLVEPSALTDVMEETILNCYQQAPTTLSRVLHHTSTLLASLTHCAGWVTLPLADSIVCKHLEFIPLDDKRMLGILVDQIGNVYHSMIPIDGAFSYTDLEKMNNFANRLIYGLNLADAKLKLTDSLQNAQLCSDTLYKNTVSFSNAVLSMDSTQKSTSHVSGMDTLIDSFPESSKSKDLVATLTESPHILELLNNLSNQKGVKVVIGDEHSDWQLNGMSLVVTGYWQGKRLMGSIGVVGPKRMNYAHVIPIVQHTSHALGAYLDQWGG